MDFIFKVDPIRRNIKVPDAFTVLTMDHNIHKLVFVCPYYEDFAFDSASIVFMVDAPDGRQYSIPAEEYESFPNSPSPYVKFTLTLKSYITSVVGYMSFCITADIISSGNVIEKSWHSKNITISIGGHINNDDSEDIPEEDVPTINQRLNNLDSKVGRLQTTVNGMSGGVPPTASSTSGMDPDESTVYINTTDGNWYYYDGSAWQIGGQYGGAVTDSALNIEGRAADAKAVGDALDELETAINAVELLAIPVAVKTAILTLFENVAFYKTDVSDEAAVVAAWAQEIASVTIDEATVSITRDGVKQLAAVTVPAGGSVIWESSNTNVATVSANGVVQGTGNGTCTITATSGSKTATCTVTVSGFTMYSVISLLTNCTSDNATTSVIEGSAYHATISTTQGRFDTLTCTMGGVSQTVTNGVIDIASVTGDIVITAVGAASAYSAANVVLDGTEYVNTGIELFSAENLDRDFRLVVEIPTIGTMQVDPFGVVVGSMEETGVVGYPGFAIRNKRDQFMQMVGRNVFLERPDTWAPYALGIKRISGHYYYWYGDETSAVEATDTYITSTALVNCPVVLGCQLSDRGTIPSRYWAGTIDSIEIKWI